MTHELVLQDLTNKFGDAITNPETPYDLLTIDTNRETIIDLLRYLKSHREFQFIFLTAICAVHYPKNTGKEMAVVYHLHSWAHNYRLRIKVYAPINDLVVPTATVVYRTANWMERETYDNLGVVFAGHPDLRRILNVDDMDYFPLRKEYPLEDQIRKDKVDYMFGR